jgi:hypothetical protein
MITIKNFSYVSVTKVETKQIIYDLFFCKKFSAIFILSNEKNITNYSIIDVNEK